MLDRLHFHKIELSDVIFVVNALREWCLGCRQWCEAFGHVGYRTNVSSCCSREYVMRPYVGDSTRREIEYATKLGKRVDWLNPPTDMAGGG
jgi:hypothetical protein